MEITRATVADDELGSAFDRLLPQLSTARPPTRAELAAIVADAVVLIARDAGAIVGALTLTLYRIPTGLQARIDDVVVDGAARGRGIGEALSREAIRIAREAGARNVSLTSRPAREAANRLYQRIGFQRLDTNVYRYPLD
ncbi:MAG TPA: GNAT family N-acetyltransferase [Kofleriaceae bacterium]|nr:GNAT family N-acetyltransferase [Kofleriaceae bacterium]